jgi:nucleoside phosphorylase
MKTQTKNKGLPPESCILLLTVSELELSAVLAQLGDTQKADLLGHNQNKLHFSTRIGKFNGYTIVAVCSYGAGIQRIKTAMMAAMYQYQPCFALFVGIGGGIGQDIGTVVISDHIADYTYSIENDTGTSFIVKGGGIATELIPIANRIQHESKWAQRILPPNIEPKEEIVRRAVVGTVGAGNVRVTSEEGPTIKMLASANANTLVVDMESGACYDLAQTANPTLPFIVVRGVSDRLFDKDPVTDEYRQPWAAAHASAAAFEFLQQFTTENGNGRESSEGNGFREYRLLATEDPTIRNIEIKEQFEFNKDVLDAHVILKSSTGSGVNMVAPSPLLKWKLDEMVAEISEKYPEFVKGPITVLIGERLYRDWRRAKYISLSEDELTNADELENQTTMLTLNRELSVFEIEVIDGLIARNLETYIDIGLKDGSIKSLACTIMGQTTPGSNCASEIRLQVRKIQYLLVKSRTLEIDWIVSTNGNGTFQIVFGIKNLGPNVAKNPALRFFKSSTFEWSKLKHKDEYQIHHYDLKADTPYAESCLAKSEKGHIIHVGETDWIVRLEDVWHFRTEFKPFTFKYEISTEETHESGECVVSQLAFAKNGRVPELGWQKGN